MHRGNLCWLPVSSDTALFGSTWPAVAGLVVTSTVFAQLVGTQQLITQKVFTQQVFTQQVFTQLGAVFDRSLGSQAGNRQMSKISVIHRQG